MREIDVKQHPNATNRLLKSRKGSPLYDSLLRMLCARIGCYSKDSEFGTSLIPNSLLLLRERHQSEMEIIQFHLTGRKHH